jgi:hypothetical protein
VARFAVALADAAVVLQFALGRLLVHVQLSISSLIALAADLVQSLEQRLELVWDGPLGFPARLYHVYCIPTTPACEVKFLLTVAS